MKWNSKTIRMARPRTPSSAGMCPRGRRGGPRLASGGAPDIVSRFDGVVRCPMSKSAELIGAPHSRPDRGRDPVRKSMRAGKVSLDQILLFNGDELTPCTYPARQAHRKANGDEKQWCRFS